MKVKIFSGRKIDKHLPGGNLLFIEDDINQWLDENKNIKVLFMLQNADPKFHADYGGYSEVVITILYEAQN